MLNKKIISKDIRSFCRGLATEFGQDSWELFYAEEYLEFLESSYHTPDADDDIKPIINKLSNLLIWVEEKMDKKKYAELSDQIKTINTLVDFLKEYEGKNWR